MITKLEWEQKFDQLYKCDVDRMDATKASLKSIEKWILGDIDQELEGNTEMSYEQCLEQYLSDRSDLLKDILDNKSLPVRMAIVHNFIEELHPSCEDYMNLKDSNYELLYKFLFDIVVELEKILVSNDKSANRAINRLKKQINESHGR